MIESFLFLWADFFRVPYFWFYRKACSLRNSRVAATFGPAALTPIAFRASYKGISQDTPHDVVAAMGKVPGHRVCYSGDDFMEAAADPTWGTK